MQPDICQMPLNLRGDNMTARKPVKIDNIEFDAVMNKDEHYDADIPDYPTESGYSVSDTITIQPFTLNMTLFVTENPITWRNKIKKRKNRVEYVTKHLVSLFESKKPFTIVTSEKTYKNMLIASMTLSTVETISRAKEIPISFKQITVTKTKTSKIPKSYKKSGQSKKKTGTANTKKATSNSSGSSNNSKNSSSSSSSNSSSKSGGSLLYNASSKLGLFK